MSDETNSGETHWSFLHAGTPCHLSCVRAEMHRIAAERDRFEYAAAEMQRIAQEKAEIEDAAYELFWGLDPVIGALKLGVIVERIKAKREGK